MLARSRFCPSRSLPVAVELDIRRVGHPHAVGHVLRVLADLERLDAPVVLVAAQQLRGLVGSDEAVVVAALVQPAVVELACSSERV
jgi:hypothetical protein